MMVQAVEAVDLAWPTLEGPANLRCLHNSPLQVAHAPVLMAHTAPAHAVGSIVRPVREVNDINGNRVLICARDSRLLAVFYFVRNKAFFALI